jgi:outer membrane autotransporter protein
VAYSFEQIAPGLWALVSHINAAAGVAPMASINALVLSVQNFFEPANALFATQHPSGPLVASPQSPEANRPVGGLWIRGNGGQNTVTATGTTVLPGGEVLTTDASAKTNYAGYQGGWDSGWLNLGGTGWNAHVGFTAGQVFGDARDLSGLGTLKLTQNFVGLYAVVTLGNLFADAMIRRDFYEFKPSFPALGPNADFDGKGIGFVGTLGYHFRANGFFVEPQLGLNVTRAEFDPVALPFDQRLNLADVDSTLGRASLRLGTTFTVADRAVVQPYVIASVLHEFEKGSSTQFFEPIGNVSIPITQDRVGTFGQIGGGIAAQLPGTGVLGFIRGDGRFGDKIEGWSVQGGLRISFNSP